MDITSAVTAGQTADVRVLVAAIADAEQVGTFWQNAFMNVSYTAASLKSGGLTGSVFLESRSSEARVTDVFVRTSTRKKEISLDVELAGVKHAGPVHVVADMLNEKGEVEKSFAADAVVISAGTQAFAVSWPWADPRLWDVGQPDLYTLRLKVKGAGLDDEYNQKFGFREFWIEGRQFYLNGTVIHLRQPCFYNGSRMQMGDIFSEMGEGNVDARGDAADSGRNLEDADRKGYLVAHYILNANKYLMSSKGRFVWEQNRQRAFDRAAVWMRHYHNHPSVVIWIAGFNFFNNAVDADPRHLGRRGWDQSDERWQRLMLFGKEMFDGLKKLDQTRAYYSHSGAYTGDIYTMNCYLDMIPLQEREDWLSAWAEGGEMPISMVEFGTPMDCTFRRGRHGFESNITSEPLLTEYAAIYFGTDAYAAEEPKYRQYLHGLFRSGTLYESSENRLDEYANNHKIQQLYRINTWRSWRSAGL
ncbi:MAG TPA: beta-galactosidase, partial [Verrucomicrobiae bacterium]